MDKTLKKKWVKALRSGEYIQGKNYYKYTDEVGEVNHCCLGVLAEIHPNVTWTSKECVEGFETYQPTSLLGDCEGFLSVDILDKEHQGELVKQNDSGQSSFEEIADYIEENL